MFPCDAVSDHERYLTIGAAPSKEVMPISCGCDLVCRGKHFARLLLKFVRMPDIRTEVM